MNELQSCPNLLPVTVDCTRADFFHRGKAWDSKARFRRCRRRALRPFLLAVPGKVSRYEPGLVTDCA
jgi:hypothetical protein